MSCLQVTFTFTNLRVYHFVLRMSGETLYRKASKMLGCKAVITLMLLFCGIALGRNDSSA